MPDTRGVAGFGLGFAQTSNAMSRRGDVEVLQERNQMEQKRQFRERIDVGVSNSMKLLKDAAKANSAAAFSAADPEGKQRAVEVQTRAAQGLWKSTQQALEAGKQQGLYTDQEIATIKEQFRIAATLRNPVAEAKLDEQVTTQGAIDTAEGTLRSKKDLDRFQTDQDIRLKAAPAAPTTQNINTTDLTKPVTTQLQTQVIEEGNTALELRELAGKVEFDQVGIVGAAGELFMDKMLGTVFASAVDKERVSVRQFIRGIRERALRTMTTDNRLNMVDRPKVEEIFPEDVILTNVTEVKEKSLALAELLESRVARKSGLLKEEDVPHLMTKERIMEKFKAGEMPEDQAMRLLRVYHGFE